MKITIKSEIELQSIKPSSSQSTPKPPPIIYSSEAKILNPSRSLKSLTEEKTSEVFCKVKIPEPKELPLEIKTLKDLEDYCRDHPLESRLTLAKNMLESGSNYDVFLENVELTLERFGFIKDCQKWQSPEERLELIKTLIKELGEPIKALLNKHIADDRGFLSDIKECKNPQKKLELLSSIIAILGDSAQQTLARHFEKMGFIKHLKQSKSPEKRIELMKELVAVFGESGQKSLIAHASILGFQEDFKKCATFEERLAFFALFNPLDKPLGEALQSALGRNWLLSEFSTKSSFQEKLELSQAIVDKLQELGSDLLGYQVSLLKFSEHIKECSNPQERLSALKSIIDLLPTATRLIDNLMILGFEKDFQKCRSPQERLELAESIIHTLGEPAEKSLGFSLERIGFIKDLKECKSPESRLDLCKSLVVLFKDTGKKELIKNLMDVGFSDDFKNYKTPEARLAFIRLVATLEDLELELSLINSVSGRFFWVKNDFKSCENDQKRLELMQEFQQIGDLGGSIIRSVFESLGLNDTDQIENLLDITRHAATGMNPFTQNNSLAGKAGRQIVLEDSISPIGKDIPYENLPFNIYRDLREILKILYKENGSIEESEIEEFIEFLESNEKLKPFRSIFETQIAKLLEKTKDADKEYVYQELWKISAYTAGVLYDLDDDRIDALRNNPGWINSILDYRRPSFRYSLIRELSYLPTETLTSLTKEISSAEKIRPLILLSRLETLGILNATEKQVAFTAIKKGDFFKDTGRQIALYDFLLELIRHPPSNTEEISLTKSMIAELFPQNLTKKELPLTMTKIKALSRMQTLFGKEAFFSALRDKEHSYEDTFMTRFKELFIGLEDIPNLESRFEETFGQFRDPTAVFTYLNRVKQLPEPDKTSVHAALSQYVAATLNGTFSELRYGTVDHPHLTKLFTEDSTLKNRWVSSQEKKNLELDLGESTEKVDLKAFFYQKIITDHHLTPLNDFPILRDYLTSTSERNFLNELQQQLQTDPDNLQLQIQKALIETCEGKKTLQEFIASKPTLSLGELENDLKSLQKKTAPQKEQAFSLSETDDSCDLLLIGTEVQGSCQRVDGSPHLNKCLMGYLLNGEIKAIVIKDASGKIIARSMLRLLWDGNKPILLMERIYSNVNNPAIDKALIDWATQKAEIMQLPLVSGEVGSGSPYTGELEFLGGRAPFIYSDASEGVMSGPFKVTDCHVLYEPTKAPLFIKV